MKLSVRIRGDWFAVPCKATDKIAWFGEEALRRYYRKKNLEGTDRREKVFEVRKAKGGAILDPSDSIRDILDDNDFVTVVLESDMSSPLTGPAEPVYLEEKISTSSVDKATEYMSLDGNSLSLDDLVRLGKGHYLIKLTPESEMAVSKARALLEDIVNQNKVVYGITTGFGKFARTVIGKEKLVELQENLIRSHAAGVGNPLSPERTRMLLALRINVLAKGYSGISPENLKKYIAAFNASCLPWVPEKGTVGASGDLAPLSHLALGMMGEGKMWSPNSGWADAKYVLESNNLEPIKLGPKEGLALINGTQLITSLGAEAVERSDAVCRQADVIAALSLEVLKGTTRAFDSNIHRVRPHPGQISVARRIRSLLHSETYPSEIAESHRFCDRVQDAYTLRCLPQVHGIVKDTVDFVRGVLTTELNSATDNPMVFAEQQEIISGGNFHGEYPAKVLDYLAIGVHELANISERRIERLVNPAYSELPAFLTQEGGLNSGFMIAHCTAAALVSENKVLCHPASVDSLTTSAGTEDHVSMGGFAARKAVTVVEHVEQVLAIELLCACQAIEFLRPLKSTAPLEAVYKLVRTVAGPWIKDRYMAPDIDAVTKLIQDEKVWHTVKPLIENYHATQVIETRVLSPTTAMRTEGPAPKRRRVASERKGK
ncbi:histidine ammonia-lyase-like [Mya arenaria]|uniref:histidine ammonia-lyase-like n=1 Tax=Mya arenaria TaxID=6604 RepID=UPI0022E6512E|nr:histidine ammonia-lyase-like [Mya arenaria]